MMSNQCVYFSRRRERLTKLYQKDDLSDFLGCGTASIGSRNKRLHLRGNLVVPTCTWKFQ